MRIESAEAAQPIKCHNLRHYMKFIAGLSRARKEGG